jgi:hypothetical protein
VVRSPAAGLVEAAFVDRDGTGGRRRQGVDGSSIPMIVDCMRLWFVETLRTLGGLARTRTAQPDNQEA